LLRDIIIDKTENPACFMKQSSNIIISQHEVPRIHPPRSVNFSLLLLLLLRGCSWTRTTLPQSMCQFITTRSQSCESSWDYWSPRGACNSQAILAL
jgi:hypothetical protein